MNRKFIYEDGDVKMRILMQMEGIEKKIEAIKKQINLIGEIPGNFISFTTAGEINANLIELQKMYEKELERRKEQWKTVRNSNL